MQVQNLYLPQAAAEWHAHAVKGYGQYCPIARGAEIFAERWTPLIVRNISLGCRSFNEILRGAPGLSKTLLSDRLRTLERVGIIESSPNPRGRGAHYALTDAGDGLAGVLDSLGRWADEWTEIELEHMDPYVVLWATCRAWDPAKSPQPNLCIRFDLTDFDKAFWILIEHGTAELCVRFPGFEEDLVVTTDRETLTLWHAGKLTYRAACRHGLTVQGRRDLVRSFPTWIPLSKFAG